MKKVVEKEPKVALCRACRGTGRAVGANGAGCLCEQCEGSGRVVVSMRAEVDIRPYRDRCKY